VADLSHSKEFEIRMELPTDKSEHDTFLANAKGNLRKQFASLLAEDAIPVREWGPVQEKGGSQGVTVPITLTEQTEINTLESRIRKVIPDAKVTGRDEDTGKPACRKVIVATSNPDDELVRSMIKRELASEPFPRTRKIGPDMAQKMIEKAMWAMFFAMIGIVIYMAFRFQLRFGIGAVVALIHDVLFTMGALAVARVDVNLPIIAAFLTIVGYSLNDTIVVFDRMRENMKTMKNAKFVDIVNLSINQTLGRTLLTSLTTLLAAGALFVWGGGVIHNFAYALIVGIVAGTYSSIFVASPIVVLWEGKRST
jgi:preprotein translocase SecF subunit